MIELITAYIIQTALTADIEPSIALAIATHESGLDYRKVGAVGEIGIFQLRPEYWPTSKKDWKKQVNDGIKVLAYMKSRCEPFLGKHWFLCFNVGITRARSLTNVGTGPYARRIAKYAKDYEIQNTWNLSRN